MSEINGRSLVVKIGSTKIGAIISQNLTKSKNMIETSNKDTGDDSDFIAGRGTWTLDVTCHFDPADTAGQEALRDNYESGTAATYSFGPETPATGDITWSGSALVSDYSVSADDESPAEISFTLQGKNGLTEATQM